MLDHERVEDFLPPSRLGTEDRNIRVKTETTSEKTDGEEEVGKDISEFITGLEDSETE